MVNTLDPIPTFLLKESLDLQLSYLTAMINASLREGCLPVSQKHAIISPLLKKPSLDDGANYRPVSTLTFISKVVKRVVADQVMRCVQAHNLLGSLQSAYRRHRSILCASCPTFMSPVIARK